MAAPLSPTDDGTLRADSASMVSDLDSAQPLLLTNEPDLTPNAHPASRVNSWISRQTEHASHMLATRSLQFFQWMNSVQGRGVLKCSIAYSIASLATFVGPIAGLLGKPEGKHVVATITVYFHAARSTGSMIEAVLIATVAVAYAELVSIISMVTSVLVGSQLRLVTLAHVLVVVIFIGGGFGFMGWVKQRMDNPLVNVGSTLASLAIIGVVTKENAVVDNVFSNQKIAQVFKMLLMGISTATAVNLLLWPVSARQQLHASMSKASAALGNMLSDVTASFLENARTDVREESTAFAVYDRAYAVLRKDLREAKFEHYFVGRERLFAAEYSVTKALKTLSQSIGGLRSAAKTHNGLLRTLQSASTEVVGLGNVATAAQQAVGNAQAANQALGLVEKFTDAMKPSMDSLSAVLSQVLLEPPFGPHEQAPDANDNFRFRLTERLAHFTSCRIEALQELYTAIELERPSAPAQALRPIEEVAASCGHFSFSLQVFGEEMQKYLDVLEDLKAVGQQTKRSWQWLKWWRAKSRDTAGLSALPFETRENELLVKPTTPVVRPQPMRRRYTYDQDDSAPVPGIFVKLSQAILGFVRKMARDDILFGIKVGIGASLWASLAFIEDTRDWYNHYRGEWGLLSFMIVCSMTVGASNTTGWARFLGTLIGAVLSVVNWNLSQGNAVALVILGWMVSFYNFYLIVARGKAPLGRMTILAYNVSTLHAYSLSQHQTDSNQDEGGIHPVIMEIVKHRAISVTAGILWGLIICRLIWPISARRKFTEGISMLMLQMGLIWRRGPLAILLRSDCSESYLKSGEQAALQNDATRLENLRHSAVSEFELRGPFPFHRNGRILGSTKRILDSFYAMSLVTQPRGALTAGERSLLEFTAVERAVLCDRICHIFQVLASSMMLEYSLTEAIPSIMSVRERLLSKIFQFRELHVDDGDEGSSSQGAAKANERDYALLYAYALVTAQVARELEIAAAEVEGLFGAATERAA